MFYHLPIHVDDIEISVGCVGELNGPEPDIARGHEFGLLIDSMSREVDAILIETFSMHQVSANIANDGPTRELRWPGVAQIDGDTRSAREVSRRAAAAFDGSRHDAFHAQTCSQGAPRFNRADPKHVGLRTIDGDAGARRRRYRIRIPPRVTVF